jgi:hypothetical protein
MSARGATRLGHPIASSIRRGVTLRQEGGSQVPVSQFLTFQPLEDGTDCVAVAVIFPHDTESTPENRVYARLGGQHVADAAGVVGLTGRREKPERRWCDGSQAAAPLT